MRYSFLKYAAVATLSAGMIFAQATTGTPRAGAAKNEEGPGCSMYGRLEHMSQMLNLNATQQEQAKTIFQNARQTAEPIRQELKDNRQKLEAAAKVANNDAEIQKLSREQGRLIGQMIAIRTGASAKFYQILTPDQRVKADQMHEQWRSRMRTERERVER
jgi:Spy/CpxP family protein refolding chaperone